MKAKINEVVYCIYDGCADPCLMTEKVEFIGENSFLIGYGDCYNEDSLEWMYSDYNQMWFKDLDKALNAFEKHVKQIVKENKCLDRYKEEGKHVIYLTPANDYYLCSKTEFEYEQAYRHQKFKLIKELR